MSPLLAITPLYQFDLELGRWEHRFVRYADDVVILVKSQRAGERVMRSVTHDLHLVSIGDLWCKAQATPLAELACLVARANLLNRPLRTRRVGGVGAGS